MGGREALDPGHVATWENDILLLGAVHSYRRAESKAWGQLMRSLQRAARSAASADDQDGCTQHPIMQGFPADWQTIDEELYEHEQAWPGMTPLAQAHSSETDKTSPVIWTNTHGKARVFVTSLGHNNEMTSNPEFLDLVARGLLWTLGHLQDDGTLAPGYTAR